MEKRTVTFFSEGTRLEGDLFLPDGFKAGEQRPGIVLCHGFTGLRAGILPDYAKVFAGGRICRADLRLSRLRREPGNQMAIDPSGTG